MKQTPHAPPLRTMTTAQIVREYASASTREMGERRGITPQAVQQYLAKRGIPRRPRGGDNRRVKP